jgi:hypothetical protein
VLEIDLLPGERGELSESESGEREQVEGELFTVIVAALAGRSTVVSFGRSPRSFRTFFILRRWLRDMTEGQED